MENNPVPDNTGVSPLSNVSSGFYFKAGTFSSLLPAETTVTSIELSRWIEKKTIALAPECSKERGFVENRRRKKIKFEEETSRQKEPRTSLRSVFQHCQHILQVAGEQRLTKVISDRAVWWFRELIHNRVAKIVGGDALKAGCIYIACLDFGFPMTLNTCSSLFQVSKLKVTKSIQTIEKHHHSLCKEGRSGLRFTLKPIQFIRLFSSLLIHDEYRIAKKINQEWVLIAHFMAARVNEVQLDKDNSPQCVAAGILFMAMSPVQEIYFQVKKKICEVAQTSEVTLNRFLVKLQTHRESIFP